MYGRIDPEKAKPEVETSAQVREDANHYIRYRREYEELRRAYLKNQIDKQELLTLRGQVKAGDADGAMKGLGRLLRNW